MTSTWFVTRSQSTVRAIWRNGGRNHDYTTRVPEIHRRHGTDAVRFQQVRSSQGDCTNLWWNTRPKCDLEVPDAAADPARDANGRKNRPAGRQERRLLRDFDEADF